MADFSRYAAPTAEWIRHERDFPPAPSMTTSDIPLEELQNIMNKGRESASAAAMAKEDLHSKISTRTFQIPTRDGATIEARTYFKPSKSDLLLPVYIYIHGGGFISGSLDTDDVSCARIAAATDVVVVNMDYRHTPQSVYPTQHLDAFDAFDWIIANLSDIGGDPEKVILSGVSAGSNQAAAIMVQEASKSKSSVQILGQVLMTPWVIHPEAFPWELIADRQQSSFYQNADAPVLPLAAAEKYAKIMAIPDVKDNYMNILDKSDEILKRFPKTALAVCGRDPLRDEGLLFAQRLAANGVATKVHVFQGLPHGFRRFADLKSSQRWDELVVECIQWILNSSDKPTRQIDVVVEAFG